MQRDHKLGLALGLLVVGFAAALCFPRQRDDEAVVLTLDNAAEIDAGIKKLPIRAYTGDEQGEPGAADPAQAAAPDEPLPGDSGSDGVDLFAAPPEPIGSETPQPASDPPATDGSLAAHVAAGPDDAAPRQHIVRPGDTLSDLAERYLGSSGRFLQIYEANRGVLARPDALRPGMVLTIPSNATNNPSEDSGPPLRADSPEDTTPASGAPRRAGNGRFRPASNHPYIPGRTPAGTTAARDSSSRS